MVSPARRPLIAGEAPAVPPALPPVPAEDADAERARIRAEIVAELEAEKEAAEAALKADLERRRIIHFVEDGMSAWGQIWYTGQEVEVEVGSVEWQRTLDPEGASWMDLAPAEQKARWGRVMFRPGPWAGGGFELDGLSDEEREVLAKAPGRVKPKVLTER